MWNRLPMKSQSDFIFRCKNCQQSLFSQTSIQQYIKYSPQNLKQIPINEKFKSHTQQQYFFVFPQQFFTTALQVDTTNILLKKYYPFLLMYMFQVKCDDCKTFLGFKIQTTNQNTEWMIGKIIIDLEMLQCHYHGRNVIGSVTQKLNLALVRSLAQQKEGKKQLLHQDTILSDIQSKEFKSFRKNAQKLLRNQYKQSLKQKQSALQTTNAHTTYLSKVSTINVSSHAQDNVFKLKTQQNQQKPFKQPQNDILLEGLKNFNLEKNVIQMIKQFQYSMQNQFKLQQRLNQQKGKIQCYSSYSNCKSQTNEILSYENQIKKLLDNCMGTYSSQLFKLNQILSIIRKKVIEKIQKKKTFK